MVRAGSRAVPVVLALALAGGGPAAGQGGPSASVPPGAAGDLCVLTIEELNELTGLRFASTASGPANCTYDSDPDDDLYTMDLRIEGPDPFITDVPEDSLTFIRLEYPDGRDTTAGGAPAWESPLGIWVDIGDDVLVVQPILFFAQDPPDPATFLVPVAELALTRLPRDGGSPQSAP